MTSDRIITKNYVTLDKSTYDALQQELMVLRQRVTSLEHKKKLHQDVNLISEEIIKYQQIDQQWQESQQLLQLVMDNIPQSIFWKDRNLVYLGCNRNFARDANVDSPEDIVGKTDYDFPWTREEADFFRACDSHTMESGEPLLHIIESQQRANGQQTWLDTNKIPLRNAQGEVVGILGTYEDITVRKQAEEKRQKLNEELERRVTERTNELEILVLELQQQINERLVTEAKLRHSEERLKQLADNVPSMLYEFCLKLDGKMSFPYVSSGARDIYEIEPEVLQKEVSLAFDCVHPEDLTGLKAAIFDSAQTQENWQYEWRIITVTGKQKWLKGVSRPQAQSNGDIIWYGYITDISDRQQVEAELAKLSLVASQTENAVIISDQHGAIEWVNVGFTKITGYSLAEVEGKKPGSFLQGSLTDSQTVKNIRQAIRAQQSFQGEILNYHKGGHPYWLSLQINPIFDSQGNLVQFIAIESDITERKQAQVALEEQLHLTAFRADVDSALTKGNDLQTMLQYYTDAVVMHLDAAFARIWLLNQEENILELQVSSGIQNQINERYNCIPLGQSTIGKIALKRSPYVTNGIFQDHHGSEDSWSEKPETISFAGYPLMDQHEVLGVIAMFARNSFDESIIQALKLATDEITLGIKRYQAETQLRERTHQLEDTLQELQRTQAQIIQSEKMSSLGQMVAGVAHEINNPVNFIHGNLDHAIGYVQDLFGLVQLYQQNYPCPVAEIAEEINIIDLNFLETDLPKLLKSMQVGTKRIREIVLSLRNFARLDESACKQVDIHEGIDSTLMILHNRLKAQIDRSAIEVIKNYGNLPLINCYAGQLNQVFMNIISNGLDAIEESLVISNSSLAKRQGQIQITTEVGEENWIVIKISDNGLGVPEEVMSKLFDPFFTTKPVGKGTGLGLSVSYQIIVDHHGGQLKCNSTQGKGTEFIIQIPR